MNSNSEKYVPYPYGRSVGLPEKISEVDRAFFSMYKMDLSLHCKSAELGHYYDCTVERHFSMQRFEAAAEQFDYFRRNPHKCSLLKGGKKVLVKHIDLSQVTLPTSQLKLLMGSVKQEFDFLCRVSGKEAKQKGASGFLVDVFMILSPSPLVFYLFLERPEETLEELLRRTASSSFSGVSTNVALLEPSNVWVKKSHHWKPDEKHISLEEAKVVVCKVAKALLSLHQNGLIHGALDPKAVFIFRPRRGEVSIEGVKLSNLSCTARISLTTLESEEFRRLDISALQSMAVQVAENTTYTCEQQREDFYLAITLLTFTTDEEGTTSRTTFEALHTFVEAIKKMHS